jgi:hypothetical protein
MKQLFFENVSVNTVKKVNDEIEKKLYQRCVKLYIFATEVLLNIYGPYGLMIVVVVTGLEILFDRHFKRSSRNEEN